MNIEEKILKRVLELIKEKPMLMSEIEDKLGLSVANLIDAGALPFLRKHKLAEITPTNEGGLVKITEKGLHLLNLPNLPEGESVTPDDVRMQRFEMAWAEMTEKGKTIDLYTSDQQVESIKGIAGMAKRFNITNSDVIHAVWLCARSEVWAKLEQDLKAKHQFFAITPPLVSAKKEASKQ